MFNMTLMGISEVTMIYDYILFAFKILLNIVLGAVILVLTIFLISFIVGFVKGGLKHWRNILIKR
jgi:hypothetical protein